MKRQMGLWQLFGFALSTLLGTVLHFLYEWSGKAVWVAPFSGVNESTWEHMKLLFFPMLLFAAVERLFFRERGDFWCVKLKGTLLGLLLIPVLFYTYNGVVGQSPDWINIVIFFVSAAVAFWYEARAFKKESAGCTHRAWALAALLGIAALFVLFTFATPHLGIFKDPLTGTFGI
ncbi:MAG: hypothetical protein IJV96_08330 [Clostridia bacterium]|nr:hypothetical protein [Clostridia bacterium]